MPASYLHGVETIEIENGARPVTQVKSAVIGLIGTAPMGDINTPVQVLSEKSGAQFGTALPGFSIPQALDAIYDHGAGTVIVINVADPVKHNTAVSAEAVTVNSSNQFQLDYGAVIDGTVTVKSADGVTTYVMGTDYTIDLPSGLGTRKTSGSMPSGASLKVDYHYLDPSKVTAADIIGSVSAGGVRLGMKALSDTYNEFGYFAKILIAPGYCTQNSVSTEMISMAEKLGAVAYIDAPIGTTFAQVLAGRGPNGTINFNTSSDRARLLYPHVKVYDTVLGENRLEPLSARAAGLRAKVDYDHGYWWSNSNQEILGIVGVERQLSAMIDDPDCEVNQLNAAGITTVFNSYGTGYRLWGNRSAAYPTVTAMRNFESVRRTADVINESLRYFSLQYMDMPIDQGLIDALTESCNGFGRKLHGDGAVLGFKAWFDPARNEQTELEAGHLLISYKFTPPPPLERLSYESEITGEYLLTLKGSN